jgi:3-hydroxyanthranilate 3,4-dioxygenase
VVERARRGVELDGLRWYTRDGSGRVLFEDWFHCTDLGVQLKPVIEKFFASDCYKTDVPERDYAGNSPYPLDTQRALGDAVNLEHWVAARKAERGPGASGPLLLSGPGALEQRWQEMDYAVAVFTGPEDGAWEGDAPGTGKTLPGNGETFFYQRKGSALLTVTTPTSPETTVELVPGGVYLAPAGSCVRAEFRPDCMCLVVTNKFYSA